jgi:hypothetical protein
MRFVRIWAGFSLPRARVGCDLGDRRGHQDIACPVRAWGLRVGKMFRIPNISVCPVRAWGVTIFLPAPVRVGTPSTGSGKFAGTDFL